jgi:hypothetical protein
MARKEIKAKGRAILRAQKELAAPPFNIMDYKLSMIHALNYYNATVDDDKKKRAWAYSYWKSLGKDPRVLDGLGDYFFHSVGAVAHMASSGIPLHEADLIRLDSAFIQLSNEAKKIVVEQKADPKVQVDKQTIQDRMDQLASLHIAEFENAIDELVTDQVDFDPKGYLLSNQVKAPIAKRIGEWFKPKLKEVQSAFSGDEQLKEGYSNLGKRGCNKLQALLESMIQSCDHMAIVSKITRAPRVKKQQPPSKLVAKMKWLREFADLKMKSLYPEKIIGATEVWIYDTAKRRLLKYVAQDGYELSVKGTTLQNWDPSKSGSKIIRKPEMLDGYESMTKRPLSNLFNDIRGVVGKLNGRTSENQIILKAFL